VPTGGGGDFRVTASAPFPYGGVIAGDTAFSEPTSSGWVVSFDPNTDAHLGFDTVAEITVICVTGP
jgi:hypothetical protein